MEHTETPGLGKEAENASYMKMYIGTGKDSIIPTSKTHLSAEDAIRYAFSTVGVALWVTSAALIAGFLVLSTSS